MHYMIVVSLEMSDDPIILSAMKLSSLLIDYSSISSKLIAEVKAQLSLFQETK